jgi:hypothetical protein
MPRSTKNGKCATRGIRISKAVNNEALNHKPSRLEVTYNPAYKAGMRSDVAKALQKLADHLDSLMVDDMMVSLDKVA